jgi:murein DD-endopeptidase MepM/ murein hydrolase activator NlpD
MHKHHSYRLIRSNFSWFRIVLIGLAVVILTVSNTEGLFFFVAHTASAAPSAAIYNDLVFWDPFGKAVPHTAFKPRITHDSSNNTIEDTSYGIRNPDMGGSTCFGVDWSKIYHAGEDLYAGQANSPTSTQNADVRSIADGVVKFAPSSFNYPGLVIIIEHMMRSGEKIYSVYAHIKGPLIVKVGQQVGRGQLIGKVMYQPYTGNYPSYHSNGDDSHLHFEIRQFFSGAAIYPSPYTYCNNAANIPGVGYTYPNSPDQFPNGNSHYLDPYSFIKSHQIHYFVPLLLNAKTTP